VNEATLKGALCRKLRADPDLAGCEVIRHEEQYASGVPDISVTHQRRTVWAEVKLNRPRRIARVTPLQQQYLRSLDALLIVYAVDEAGEWSTEVIRSGQRLVLLNGERHPPHGFVVGSIKTLLREYQGKEED